MRWRRARDRQVIARLDTPESQRAIATPRAGIWDLGVYPAVRLARDPLGTRLRVRRRTAYIRRVTPRRRLMLATAAVWGVVAVAVTFVGVRHYTGLAGCEGYECDWQFRLLMWFFRPIWWLMAGALVITLLVEYLLTPPRSSP